MKLVINRCFGGFGLSERAYLWLIDHGVPVVPFDSNGERRSDDVIFDYDHPATVLDKTFPSLRKFIGRFSDNNGWLRADRNRGHALLVQCVEVLGIEANGPHARLTVVEIPDGVEYVISDYDGMERVEEAHRSWA